MEERNEIKDIIYLGKLTCSARGLRKVADWLEKTAGHAGDYDLGVSIYKYPRHKILSFENNKHIKK